LEVLVISIKLNNQRVNSLQLALWVLKPMKKAAYGLIIVLVLFSGFAVCNESSAYSYDSFQGGLNYLSSSNRFYQNDSVTKSDFDFFKANNVSFISLRLFRTSFVEDHDNVTQNFHRLLAVADECGIKVQFDFRNRFNETDPAISFPSIYDVIRNSTEKQLWFDFVGEVMGEFKSYSCIESWTMMNEPYVNETTDEEFFYQCWSEQRELMKNIDSRPVSIRFALGHSPWSGDFEKTEVLALCDYIAINEYLDPSDPNSVRYGGTWAMFEECVTDCRTAGRPLVISEFGCDSGDDEAKRVWYEQSLSLFKSKAIHKAYAWAWQTINPDTERFNIAGSPPKPAFYELASAFALSNQSNSFLVVSGSNSVIYYRMLNTTAHVWSDWSSLSGQTQTPPAAFKMGDELHVAVRGVNNGQIWHGYVNLYTNEWSGWDLLDGVTPSPPILTGNDTHLCLVVRGANNAIHYRFYTLDSRVWTSWSTVPNGATIDTPAATLTENTLQIVVRGANQDQIWHGKVDTTSNTFSGWLLLDGVTPSPPTVTLNSTHLCLIVRGTNSAVYYRWYNIAEQLWSSWTSFPYGTTPNTPAAALTGEDLQIVVRGVSEDQIWHGTLNTATSDWSGWNLLDGTTPTKPVLTS